MGDVSMYNRLMKEFYVYILQCSDGSYYTGVTNDFELRATQHQEGVDPKCYTFKRRPIKLVHLEAFDSILSAISREKQIKRWSRAKKQALIEDREEALQRLARCSKRCHGSAGSP